ncbi:acetate/propionate family kinase [Candidatus Methylacidiphilum infernorum]|uniref:Acetate kinase n=1 Tax=Methylacidiphilum infernorum (isolate V4) TaxID=481448 RepID=B3DY84_METI4|nr:acetate/propionate family kinase [Candidatus Methylacidiphilum infernorum]ACD82361.1 Acetate kinase [Methylacidiphilum infernorum V4]
MLGKDRSFILTVNSGSTSLKISLFGSDSQSLFLEGHIERIGLPQSHIQFKNKEGERIFELFLPLKDHDEAIAQLFSFLKKNRLDEKLLAVGHRIVHGGSLYREPRLITSETLQNLKELIPLAPEHLPSQILAIESFRKQVPHVKNIGCFDTAFHRTIPYYARQYALPKSLREMGIVRYGFHGLSCEHVMEELKKMAKEKALGKVIIAHLGGGASMTAVYKGQSLDTTMGFSPLSGLVMETRCGDIDPGAVLYLVKEKGLPASEVYHLLNNRSGLLGLSGISSDMKDLLEDNTQEAKEAIEIFVYQARKHLGALITALNGIDILVFTGGIGEHSALIRGKICANLDVWGIELDTTRNESHAAIISTDSSPSQIRIIKANEESVIARETFKLVSQGSLTL